MMRYLTSLLLALTDPAISIKMRSLRKAMNRKTLGHPMQSPKHPEAQIQKYFGGFYGVQPLASTSAAQVNPFVPAGVYYGCKTATFMCQYAVYLSWLSKSLTPATLDQPTALKLHALPEDVQTLLAKTTSWYGDLIFHVRWAEKFMHLKPDNLDTATAYDFHDLPQDVQTWLENNNCIPDWFPTARAAVAELERMKRKGGDTDHTFDEELRQKIIKDDVINSKFIAEIDHMAIDIEITKRFSKKIDEIKIPDSFLEHSIKRLWNCARSDLRSEVENIIQWKEQRSHEMVNGAAELAEVQKMRQEEKDALPKNVENAWDSAHSVNPIKIGDKVFGKDIRGLHDNLIRKHEEFDDGEVIAIGDGEYQGQAKVKLPTAIQQWYPINWLTKKVVLTSKSEHTTRA